MLKLAKNFAENKNLKTSFIKLINMLEKVDMRVEEKFTIESLCRILQTKKEKQKWIQKIIDISSINANSYDVYCINNNPPVHEFPIDNIEEHQKNLLLIMDRYMAIMHIIALLKKNEAKIAKQIVNLAAEVEKEYKIESEKCCDENFVEHVTNILSAGEVLASQTLKDFDTVDLLCDAIDYGYRDEDIFMNVLNKLYNMNNAENVINFYNERYAKYFNIEKISDINKIQQKMVDSLYAKKEYNKALLLEFNHAKKIMEGIYE